jgi:apolipoprotein N-acyltransferase
MNFHAWTSAIETCLAQAGARLPGFTRGILEVTVAGREGATPYVRFGDRLVLVLAVAALLGPILVDRLRRSATARASASA